jgi:hypothetical protein
MFIVMFSQNIRPRRGRIAKYHFLESVKSYGFKNWRKECKNSNVKNAIISDYIRPLRGRPIQNITYFYKYKIPSGLTMVEKNPKDSNVYSTIIANYIRDRTIHNIWCFYKHKIPSVLIYLPTNSQSLINHVHPLQTN